MQNKYKAILFDFDFTLVNPTNGVVECVNYALVKVGLAPVSVKEICRVVGYPLPDTFDMLVGNCYSEKKQEYLEYFKQKADEIMTSNTKIYELVPQLLLLLSQNSIKTGIISNKFRYRIEQLLKREKLRNKIDLVIGSEDVRNPKPDPEGLRIARDRLGILQNQILYIGDSIVDAKAAFNGGFDFAAILSGSTTRKEFDGYPVKKIINNIPELMAWINE